jgi:hypothetical protein
MGENICKLYVWKVVNIQNTQEAKTIKKKWKNSLI